MNGKAAGTLIVYGVVMVGLTVIMVKAQRAASSPDFGRTAQMKVWRGIKGVADKNSQWWGGCGTEGRHYVQQVS